ncbi:MAG: threonine--tRNA ligase [Candidatus Helarchaeota archaeon]
MLTIHSDYIEIEVKKKAIKSPEPIKEKKIKVGNCLVVFTAIERDDGSDIKEAAKKLAEEVEGISSQISEKTIVLYPYAHLSSDLIKDQNIAMQILDETKKILEEKNYIVYKAPFGWYKAFKISCKGHPLSELSRQIFVEQITREEVVKEIESKYIILTPEGKEYKINLDNLDQLQNILKEINNELLEKYIYSEELEGIPHKEPPSISAMQHLELVDYAPEADAGHFKFFPKGKLIFDLICDWAFEIAVNRLHAIEIDTPILYNWDDPEIKKQGLSFHEKHYIVTGADTKKKLILRFAGDFGLFKMMKKAKISYKSLPLRVYEFSKSFRYEKHGELTGLRRLRGFHMPDIHCFTANLDKGWEEYQELYRHYDDLAKGTGIEFAVVFRVVDTFYEKNKNKIVELLKYSKLPAFIEILSSMKHYWAVKHEFQGIDSVGGNCQLCTVQLDVVDSETYGLTYTDKDGEKKPFIIVHSSLGSIERWMFSILEDAFKKEKPMLPIWLSPTQVRIIPVQIDKNLMDYCEKISEKLESSKIRVDIDDRDETLSKRIRNAELEWIPYIVVIGNEELNTNKLAIRIREDNSQKKLELDKLILIVKDKTSNMPFRKLSLSKYISRRPSFI